MTSRDNRSGQVSSSTSEDALSLLRCGESLHPASNPIVLKLSIFESQNLSQTVDLMNLAFRRLVNSRVVVVSLVFTFLRPISRNRGSRTVWVFIDDSWFVIEIRHL